MLNLLEGSLVLLGHHIFLFPLSTNGIVFFKSTDCVYFKLLFEGLKKKQARNVIENAKDRKLDCKHLVNKNAGLFSY